MGIPYNTMQKVRLFLAALDVPPSVFADSREVLSLLTAGIRRHRGDPAIREKFFELLNELRDRDGTDSACLPAPLDESIDATILARELERIWSDEPIAGPFVRQRMLAAILVLALLLLGLTLNLGCGSDDDDSDDPARCAQDISADNFAAMIGSSEDLTPAQNQEAVNDYNQLDASDQEKMISDLCGMSAEEIAAYLEGEFGPLGDAAVVDDDDDNDDNDDAAVYKGVSF